MRSELLLKDSSSSESGNVEQVIKMDFSYAVKVLHGLVTETVVLVGQTYASHEIVLATSRSDYVPGGTVPNVKGYGGLRNIIRNISVAINTIQRSFARKKVGSNKVLKSSFVVNV